MSIFSFINHYQFSDNFVKLICSYEEDSVMIAISKDDLTLGFKNIDSLNCIKKLNILSLWFILRRDNKSSKPIIIKFEDRKQIPEILNDIMPGDDLELTILCDPEYIQRRIKIIKILH